MAPRIVTLSLICACTGAIGASDADDTPQPGPLTAPIDPGPFVPLRASMQRLTQPQYASSVRAILGDVDIPEDLEQDDRTSGFVSLNATLATVSPVGVEKYESAAFAIATQAVLQGEAMTGCSLEGASPSSCAMDRCPAEDGWAQCATEAGTCDIAGANEVAYGVDDAFFYGERSESFVCGNALFGDPAPGLNKTCWVRRARTTRYDASCLTNFVESYGRRFFRRPATPDEVERYVALGQSAAEALGEPLAAFEYVLASFLQSPAFLFRAEVGAEDPARYEGYELASRLAFVLWNRTPDDALLDAAGHGELEGEGLVAQVDRMLASPLAREGIRNFFMEMLHTNEVLTSEKDAGAFSGFDDAMRRAAFDETLALVEHWSFDLDADYRALFTTNQTFLNNDLAEHYGVPTPGSDALVAMALPEGDVRRGLLTHTSFLATYSHSQQTSAALRGRFVRQVLLCGRIPDPPPEVSTVFPPSDAPTLRERVETHLQERSCATCHVLMDPVGLGLENFDAVGRFRALENGATIDPTGQLDGDSFVDAVDLGRAVAEHEDLPECFARNLLRYATGELEGNEQYAEIARLRDGFVADGHRIRGLLRAIVLSPMFLEIGEES